MASSKSPIEVRSSDVGARISVKATVREMKLYPLMRHEVDSIAAFNSMVPIMFSLATALLGFAGGIYVNVTLLALSTGESRSHAKVVISVVGITGIIVLALAVVIARMKIGSVKKIMDAVSDESMSESARTRAGAISWPPARLTKRK